MTDTLRTCIACRKKTPSSELIRVVRLAGNGIAVDPGHRLNGRGAYLCPALDCLKRAKEKKLLELHLKQTIPAAVYEELAGRLGIKEEKELPGLLGLAIKAGKARPGYSVIEGLAQRGKLRLILYERELSPASLKKLESLSRKTHTSIMLWKGILSLERISGRANCRVVGITDAGFADSIRKKLSFFDKS